MPWLLPCISFMIHNYLHLWGCIILAFLIFLNNGKQKLACADLTKCGGLHSSSYPSVVKELRKRTGVPVAIENIYVTVRNNKPIPVTMQSKARLCGCWLSGIAGSNPTGGVDVCLLWVLCCQVEVSASGWSLIQRTPTKCGVSECDCGALIMSRPWPIGAVAPWGKKQ